ncbi:MAG: hypothetical protein AB8G15_02970 [Saprospiraceae bacterium]
MKYIKICCSLLLLFLIITSCRKDENITIKTEKNPSSVQVTNLSIEGFIQTEASTIENVNSIYNSIDNYWIQNATVELVYNGEVLASGTTDGGGFYELETLKVPLSGAVLKVKAPNYYPNALKIDVDTAFNTNVLNKSMGLLPRGYGDFSGEMISTDAPKVNITGFLKNSIPNTTYKGMNMYIKDSYGRLVGNHLVVEDYIGEYDYPFTITTLANQELYLYYQLNCHLSEPIPIGPLTEDLDLGKIEFTENYPDEAVVLTTNITNCNGFSTNGYASAYFGQETSQSHFWDLNGSHDYKNFALDCQLKIPRSIAVTAFRGSNFEYVGEKIVDYIPGQDLTANISVCDPNETYFKYELNGEPEKIVKSISFANKRPNGSAVLEIITIHESIISISTTGTYIGSHSGDFIYRSGDGRVNFSGEGITIVIDQNDGEYLEGTFSGTAVDPSENSLGVFAGSFKAKIR